MLEVMPISSGMRPLVLVGVDGGLAAFGVSVAHVTPTGLRFTRAEVWTSKPAPKARRLRRSDDTAERIRALAGNLHALLTEARPVAVCIESNALPFGRCRSSVVSMLGRVRGVVDSLCHIGGVPLLEETPQRLKAATAGVANASKVDVQAALESAYPELREMWPAQLGLQEHAADACAAVHACRSADVVLAALRAREVTP